jgi:hypothetical protein
MKQWDIVKVRINEHDRDEHPAVVISPDEVCANARAGKINVLYGSKIRPVIPLNSNEIPLNGADGLEFRTKFDCAFMYAVSKQKISQTIGEVAYERRFQISRKIAEVFRLKL